MASAFKAYQGFLTRRPLLGNVVSSGVLFATGDLIAQQAIEKKGSKHDYARTGRIVTWGAFGFAPIATYWFRFLERTVTVKNRWAAAGIRTAMDQVIAAPVVISLFFTTMGLMEGKSLEDSKKKVQNTLWPTLKTNWMVFVPTQLLNMSLVPLQYRLLVINGVNIPWNSFLSIQNAKASKQGVVESIKNA